jgi:hypothetical protein
MSPKLEETRGSEMSWGANVKMYIFGDFRQLSAKKLGIFLENPFNDKISLNSCLLKKAVLPIVWR